MFKNNFIALLILCGMSFGFIENDFIKNKVSITNITHEYTPFDLSFIGDSKNGIIHLNIGSDEGTITYEPGLNDDGILMSVENFTIISWSSKPGVIFLKGYENNSRNIFVGEIRYNEIVVSFAMHVYRKNGFSLIHNN